MFSNSRKKQAHQTAQRLLTGHTSLLAFWALKHAQVLAALQSQETVSGGGGGGGGIDPREYAVAKSMSPEILAALCGYLAQQGILQRVSGASAKGSSGSGGGGERYRLSEVGLALLEFEDGTLEHLRSYQGVLDVMEHLLARLKTYGHGLNRKAEIFQTAQAQRWQGEVCDLLAAAVARLGGKCILDLACAHGQTLIQIAKESKAIMGVGIVGESATARTANNRIDAQGMEKRLIVVPGSALDIAVEGGPAFERAGISPQLWRKFDVIVAVGMLSDLPLEQESRVITALRGLALTFPKAAILLAEPCAGSQMDKNYHAPELQLLAALSGTVYRTAEQWRELLKRGGLAVQEVQGMETDGLTLFSCKALPVSSQMVPPVGSPKKAAVGR